MIPVPLSELAAVTGGRLAGGAGPGDVVTGPVVVDSRQVAPGALFVALLGTRADGHDHAADAVAAGAVAVLAARELDVPCIVVPPERDQLEALGALARHVVDALPRLVVVGVTGSSGKTSTKDLLAVLLGDLGPTVAPQGSFNNEIGLPLTALRCDASTRYLVAEMGARMPGNIAYLTRITPPDYAVVLNVGAAHAGVFGSREATAATKGELPEALGEGGVAVLNADDPLVAAMASRTRGRVVRFGLGAAADVRAVDVRLDAWSRPSFTLVSALDGAPGEARVELPLYGEHHVANALAAAAVALEAGLPAARIAELLAAARPASRWRMELHTRPDGVTVVNDAYNANPDSVRAALKALAAMGRPERATPASPQPARRRTWAVLGEMLELGETSLAEHDAVGRLAVRLDVSRLVAVGPGARAVHTGASQEGSWGEESAWVPDAAAALALLRAELAPGDVVLVKASRSAGLDVVATALLDDVHGSGPGPVLGAGAGEGTGA